MISKKFFIKNTGWLATTWLLIIFVLCATPGQYIPSTDWLDLLSFDKFVHASMFFILCSLWFAHAIKTKSSKWVFAIIMLLAITYGGLLEVMQAKCFSNRAADWKDFVANSFGCLVAASFIGKIRSTFFFNNK